MAAVLWLSLPHGDSIWDLLETIAAFAFTEPMNTGGTVTGVPLVVGSESSSWTQASFRLGNVDVTDPAFWELGLKLLGDMVTEAENLAAL